MNPPQNLIPILKALTKEVRSYIYILIIGVVSVCATPRIGVAQISEDHQWFSARISQEIGEYRWSFEENIRLRYGLSIVDKHFSEFGLRRKVNKHLQLQANYRFGWNDPGTRPELFHRFNLDARVKKKWKKKDLELLWRPRIQLRLKPGEDANKPAWYVRNKVTLQRKINKTFDVWVAGELFTRLNDKRYGLNNNEFRSYLGLDIDVGKRKDLSVFYMWSEEFSVRAPERGHVIGVAFKYKLKKWKK